MNRPPYEVIDFTPEYPIESVLAHSCEEFEGLENYPPNKPGTSRREFDIQTALNAAAIRHLGIPKAEDASSYLNDGLDVVIDLYFGDWWINAPRLKSREELNEEIAWFQTFSQGLLLAMLANRWGDAKRLCSWGSIDLLQKSHGVSPEVAAFYLVVAGDLREGSLNGIEEARELIEKTRTKKAKLLLQAWDAVLSDDQTEFDKVIRDSLRRFAKSVAKTGIGMNFTELLAQPQSLICLTAMHRGLRFPDLPEELSVFVITRRSLGLVD